jgi:hypothetical protein
MPAESAWEAKVHRDLVLVLVLIAGAVGFLICRLAG